MSIELKSHPTTARELYDDAKKIGDLIAESFANMEAVRVAFSKAPEASPLRPAEANRLIACWQKRAVRYQRLAQGSVKTEADCTALATHFAEATKALVKSSLTTASVRSWGRLTVPRVIATPTGNARYLIKFTVQGGDPENVCANAMEVSNGRYLVHVQGGSAA